MSKPEQDAIPAKQKLTTSTLMVGYCKYCGQGHQIETSGTCTEEQLKEWATEECNCELAQDDKQRKKAEEKAHENIKKMFGNHDTGAILKASVHAVMMEAVDQVTVVIDRSTKATMKLNDKGKIKIEKTITEKNTLEG